MANIISSLIVELVANTAKFSSGMEQANKSIDSMKNSLSLIKFDAIVNLGERAVQAGKQLMAFFEIGAKAKQMEMSFNMITDASGIMGNKLIDDIKRASGVFVEETGIMQKAQRAMIEGLSPEQIVDMTKAARVAARLMGTDVKEAYDQVMEAVISLRTRGLKAAFPMEAEEVYKKYAESVGRTADELTEYGKREALVNEIRDQTIARLEVMGELQETEAEKIEKTKSTFGEIKEAMAKVALEGVNAIGAFAKKFGVDMTQMEESAIEGEIIVVGAISNIDKKISEISSKGEDKRFKIAGPEKDWIKDFVESIHHEIDALNELGVVSEAFYTNQIKWAGVSMAQVKKYFQEGKVSALDYANALKSVTKMYEDLTGGDITKQLADLEERTSEAMKAVDKNLPDWQKQMAKITDAWIVERNKIQEKDPLYIRANLSKWENDLKVAEEKALASGLYHLPDAVINVKANIEGSSGGTSSGYASSQGIIMPGMAGYSEAIEKFEVKFTGSGMSPEMPLGEAFDKLGNRINEAESDMASLKFVVDFSSASTGFERQAKKLETVLELYNFLMSSFGSAAHSKITGFGSTYEGKKVFDQMQETLDNIFNEQVKQLESFLEMTGRALTPELWARFIHPVATSGFPQTGGWTSTWAAPFSYEDVKSGFSSYQSGTPYVPRTGLAMVHEGERIVSKTENRNVNMGGVVNHFYIQGGDPKKVAEAVASALQYDRSGNLKKQIRKLII